MRIIFSRGKSGSDNRNGANGRSVQVLHRNGQTGEEKAWLRDGAEISQALDHGNIDARLEKEVMVRMGCSCATDFEAGGIGAEDFNLAIEREPLRGFFRDVRAVVRLFGAILLLSALPHENDIALQDFASLLEVVDAYGFVDIFMAEIEPDRRTDKCIGRKIGSVLAAGVEMARNLNVRSGMRPHMDIMHDVPGRRRAECAALLDLDGVLLLSGQEDVGEVDDLIGHAKLRGRGIV